MTDSNDYKHSTPRQRFEVWRDRHLQLQDTPAYKQYKAESVEISRQIALLKEQLNVKLAEFDKYINDYLTSYLPKK